MFTKIANYMYNKNEVLLWMFAIMINMVVNYPEISILLKSS